MPPSTRRSKAAALAESEHDKTPSKPPIEQKPKSTAKSKRRTRRDVIDTETPAALRTDPKQPQKQVKSDLTLKQKMEKESRRLQRECLGGTKLTEVSVTSLALQKHGPFNLVLPRSPTPESRHRTTRFREPNERLMREMMKPSSVGILGRMRTSMHGYIYAGKQLAVFMAFVICWMLSLGTLRFTNFWKRWAYRYPPTPTGWDLFGIRMWIVQNMRQQNPIEVKKRVWYNPDTGRYETVTYTRLHDPGIYRDRWPGETDGIDPEEFGKYHYLSAQEVMVKWLGERVVKPLMRVFHFCLLVWVLSFSGIVIISVGHMYLVEFLEWLGRVLESKPELEEWVNNAWENIHSLVGSIWNMYLPSVFMRVLQRLIGA
ncbi:hypothetical protein TWF696_008629 [Orbilia brochopaga]|uniref:Uncharacterized protein n=1 Tax=Orbilia brochopaga TaxID=3140254 RepID=A0AAV9UJU3_9PEZI